MKARDAKASDALRSNCLFAVSLGLVTGERAKRCVEAAQKFLVVGAEEFDGAFGCVALLAKGDTYRVPALAAAT